jgi:hypothetical protein
MKTNDTITITLTKETADVLAILAKRFGYNDATGFACSRYAAETIIDAVVDLEHALRDAGFVHR